MPESEYAPGLPVKGKITPLPRVKKPEVWELSAHPHHAERAGVHTDLRLGNPGTGVAHSFVIPRREGLPGPGTSSRVIPTSDHTLRYMDFTGEIPSGYGKGRVLEGRREKTEVYHADPGDEPGTKLRFNLYGEASPEEFAIRKDRTGKWFLHNKTQTRERRPDIPAFKPKYKEVDVDSIDAGDSRQAMMPKLDGAHAIIDLRAGRAPRLYSYREAKRTGTGLIEHTHKAPRLLEKKVPKELDGTLLRGEILGLDAQGRPIPTERLAGLLNAKVWESRRKQEAESVRLKAYPFSVVKHRGKSMEEAPFSERLEVLKRVEKSIPELEHPPVASTPEDKVELLNAIRSKTHPLTEEGVVLVDKDHSTRTIKAKFIPDYDVYIRDVHPAISGKTGKPHDRAGAVSYSWTPDGPVVGQLGGFKHEEARDMLANPDKYIGRVAKVKAMKRFGTDEEPGALFQARFKEWHLDKGDIEKAAMEGFHNEIEKIALKKLIEGGKKRIGKAWDVVSGKEVKNVTEKHFTKAMESSALKKDKDNEVIQEYVRGVLTGDKRMPKAKIPKSKGRKKLMKDLEKGRSEVEAAQKRKKWTRRGLGAASVAGTAVGVKTAAEEKEESKPLKKLKEVAPVAAGTTVGSYPIAQGMRTGALRLGTDKGEKFRTVRELHKSLKPGDIILTSHPKVPLKWEVPLAASGGDIYGMHPMVVVKKGRNPDDIVLAHSNVGEGGAKKALTYLDPDEHIVVRRFKDEATKKQFMKNLQSAIAEEDKLEKALGPKARAGMYDYSVGGRARAFTRSLLPESLKKLVPEGSAGPRTVFCSGLTGKCSPQPFYPGVEGKDVLPHHVRSTPVLETVGHHRGARTLPRAVSERALAAAPWVARGLIGAGLGYGTYRGVKALTGSGATPDTPQPGDGTPSAA